VLALRERLAEWGARGGSVVRADAQAFLATAPAGGAFGLVFLDPPFAAGLLPAIAARLESGGWLDPGARVYVEAPAGDPLPAWPPGWEVLRSGRAGAVGYHLLRREGRRVATGHPT
jgi:16S rRNA (guanine966-N2)-methyltransferase